jgi:hypothetical protein
LLPPRGWPSRKHKEAGAPLKRPVGSTDPEAVARDLDCPVCQAHVPLDGDERPGDDVYCAYCGAPCVIRKSGDDPDELELEEDF